MAARSRLMATEADRRFPVRIRLAIPTGGLGESLDHMRAWLDQNADADRWAIAPSDIRTIVKDAVAVYFADAGIAGAFVAQWCAGHRAETAVGLFRVREDEPTPRVGAADTGDHPELWGRAAGRR
jgi:hypothetical protein